MKKSLLLGITGVTLIALTATSLYAQTVAGTTLVDKMKAAVGDFTLAAVLNPGQTGLKSAPIAGKKTGDILTAGEWNRVLELVSEGGSGGGSGWVDVPLTDTNPFDQQCMYRVVMQGQTYYLETIHENRAYWINTMYFDKANKSVLVGGIAPVNTATKMQKLCGGGGSSGSGPALYKCTNAQSLDTTNAPCYGASRNGGAGTNQYRVVSCSNTDASGTYTAGGLLNFGDFIANKWSFHINNSNIACADGSVLVMDIQGGGSGGSAGWEDVPLTDTADFDDSCMYRYQITYTAGGREPHVPKETYYYANGVSKTQLVWWLDNDSQLSTFHITASSKNIFRINGAPYNTVGGNPAVSIIKIEKLCGGSGGSSGAFGTAWVNFDGTESTITMKGASGIASVTKVSAGNYQINFSTPKANTDYGVICTSGPSPAYLCFPHSKTTTGVLIKTSNPTSNVDAAYVSVVIN